MSVQITLKIIVSGRVQGVGYRWFARENAQDLELTGYVKNLSDGDVEVVAQGREENVLEFTSLLRQGPSFSQVIDLKITEISEGKTFTYFEVRF